MTFSQCTFADLSTAHLYDILALRSAVFVVEQESIYLDADGLDRDAHHLMGCDDAGCIVAYLRLLGPGVKYMEPSIGRVVVAPGHRGTGLGRELMQRGLDMARALYAGRGNRLSAQLHLKRFYESFGFAAVGEPYLEDGIPHVEMVMADAISPRNG